MVSTLAIKADAESHYLSDAHMDSLGVGRQAYSKASNDTGEKPLAGAGLETPPVKSSLGMVAFVFCLLPGLTKQVQSTEIQ